MWNSAMGWLALADQILATTITIHGTQISCDIVLLLATCTDVGRSIIKKERIRLRPQDCEEKAGGHITETDNPEDLQ